MKILVLAGGYDQIDLINELKRYNHYVILADYFENPPAKKYADKFYQVSTLDVEKVREVAIKEEVNLITTACTDQALLTVAKISEEMNLPCYLSYEKAKNVTNKLYMKKIFKEYDIPTSNYFIIDNKDELNVDSLSFPLVIKPVDCNSSKGVVKVFDKNDLDGPLENAINLSRTKSAIVEEYKDGFEISVDAFVKEGCSQVLSITRTNKIENNNNCFTIYQSDYPSGLSQVEESKVFEIVQKIAEAFELDNCPLLVQLIVGKDEISVLEFSARIGGGTKHKLIQAISGIDIMKEYVSFILDKDYDIVPVKKDLYIRLNYIYTKQGVLNHIKGFEELLNKGIIDEYYVYKTKEMDLSLPKTSGDRVAGYLISDSNLNKIKNKEKIINSEIFIEDINGDNLINLTMYE